jgi:hypothetical protein
MKQAQHLLHIQKKATNNGTPEGRAPPRNNKRHSNTSLCTILMQNSIDAAKLCTLFIQNTKQKK